MKQQENACVFAGLLQNMSISSRMVCALGIFGPGSTLGTPADRLRRGPSAKPACAYRLHVVTLWVHISARSHTVPVRANLIRIGNSRYIRIPKSLIRTR